MAEKTKGLTIKLGFDNSEFKKKIKDSTSEINATDKQVKALQKSLELKWDASKFTQAQKLSQEAISKTEMKAKELRAEMAKMEAKGVDTSSASYQKLQTELIKTGDETTKLKRKLDEVNQMKVDRLANSFKNAGDKISKVGKSLMGISLAATAVIASLGKLTSDTVKTAAEIDDMSQAVNLSAEALQKWRYVALQLGLDNSTLQTSLAKTQAAFADLSKGEVSPASDALIALGFSAEEAAKGMNVNFEQMVLKLSEVRDASEQAFLVNELFGDRLGSKIIPLLNGGAEGLSKLSAEFEELGYMTNEQVQAFADYDDQWTKIKASLKSVRDELTVSLLPIMQTLTDFVDSKVVPAIRSLANWFSNLSTGQKELLLGITTFVAALAPMLLIVGKMTSGIGMLIKGVQGLQGAFTLLAAHPIVAALLAVAAVMIYLYSSNEKFRESVNGLVSELGSKFQPILELLSDAFKDISSQLMPLVDTLGNYLAPIIKVLTTALGPLVDILVNVLMRNIQFMLPAIKLLVDGWTWLASVIDKYVVPVMDKLAEGFDAFIKSLPTAFKNALKGIEYNVNLIFDFINRMIDKINTLGKVVGFSIAKLEDVSIDTSFVDKIGIGKSSDKPASTTVISDKKKSDSAITKSEYTASNINNTTVNTTNDYSNKDIVINVNVQNYADELDVKDIARRVNIEMAKQM